MVEYGGGTSPFGNAGGGDVGATIGNMVNDAVNTISTLSPIELVALVAVVFLGLIILRRAF